MAVPHGTRSTADIGDRHRTIAAFAALAVSGYFGLSAAGRIAPSETAAHLRLIAFPLALAAALLVIPVLTWKLRSLSGDEWSLYRRTDGFVADAMARAHVASWSVTFLALVALSVLAGEGSALPPGFYFEALIAVMLATLSGSFLFLNRSLPDDGDDGEGE